MCGWYDKVYPFETGDDHINATTFKAACEIISQAAQGRQLISYSELMNELKHRECPGINRRTIGKILEEVNIQVSQTTHPSIYPSAIVVESGEDEPSYGFWCVIAGTNPPKEVDPENRATAIKEYQNAVFNRTWGCEL